MPVGRLSEQVKLSFLLLQVYTPHTHIDHCCFSLYLEENHCGIKNGEKSYLAPALSAVSQLAPAALERARVVGM